ncbi:MAG: oligosaccharide flippase family protein [Gammaproteobacteria bacterium]
MLPETSLRSDVLPRLGMPRLRSLSARLWRGDRPLFALFQSLGAQVFITVINVATGVITARLLGPEGRGIYAAVTLWPPLLASLATAGLGTAVVFRMRQSGSNAGAIASTGLLLALIQSSIAAGIGVFLLPHFLSQYPPAVVFIAQLCLVSVLVNGAQTLMKQAFAGAGQFRWYNLTHLSPQLFYLLTLLAIIPFVPLTANGAILALLGSGAIATLAVIPAFKKRVQPRVQDARAEVSPLLSYSARAALTDVVQALAANADRLVLIPLLPVGELGLYAVAFSFSRVIQLVQPAIMSVVLSQMSRATPADSQRLHDMASRFLIAALLCSCAVLWVIGGWLLVFTYGSEFGAISTPFRVLIAEASFGVLSQVTMQLFLSRNRPGVVSAIQGAALCASIASLLILVPRFGTTGAALGLLLAGVFRWVLLLLAMKVVLGLPLPRLYLNRADWRYLKNRLR